VNHLLIDENLPASLASTLPLPCSHATDLGKQPPDRLLWQYAREKNWTILTRDADFFDRLMLDGPPPKVIWVRLGNIRKKDLETLLLRLWPQICDLLPDADLVEIHPNSLETFKRSDLGDV
jgi:predicted nuclease of predicted toxin-antitoxin system